MLRLAPEGEAPRIGGPDEIQYYGPEEFAYHYAMNDFDPGEIQCERIGRRCSNVHDGDTVVPQYRSRPRNEPFRGIEGSMAGGYDFFGRAGLATVNILGKTYATPASALLPLPPIPEESSPLELHRTIRIRLCGIRGQQASSTSWRPGRR